jgi:putative membrane protein
MLPDKLKRSALYAALLALGIAAGASAQTPTTTTAAAAKAAVASLSKEDQEFVDKAAMGGVAEVELGKVAATKATHPEVKKFAERMVTDHGKANDELKQLAGNRNIPLPAGPDNATKKEMTELQKLSGTKFDHEYMEHMVKDHKKDIKEFEKEAKSGKDADLKKWASDKLPTLREHLAMAEAALKAAKSEKKGK